jgi:hypothetical protein
MENGGQLQPEGTLVDRGVDDVLDEGISPPEKPRGVEEFGTTPYEEETGETLDQRVAREEPDPAAQVAYGDDEADDDRPDFGREDDPAPDGAVGDDRSGRLVAPDQGSGDDTEKDEVARDVGIDGGAASVEEAAMHVVSDTTLEEGEPASEPPD